MPSTPDSLTGVSPAQRRGGSEPAALTAWGAVLLSLRLLARDWSAGELRVLAIGLLIAVASLTTVSFFTDRVRQALAQEAGQLLGADLVVISDRPISAAWEDQAKERGLRTARTVRFPSMTLHGERTQLTEIKAVGPGYPLKGRLTIDDGRAQIRHPSTPAAGSVWADERLLARLGVAIGDRIRMGSREFTIVAQLSEDPETSISFLSLGPRLIMNVDDLESTGLVQVGSRVTYRLGIAGPLSTVREFRTRLESQMQAGQRVEDVRDARPEVRSALERAEKFLGLSALLSVLLAAVAIALAARRYLKRHLDNVAIMRCLGASQRLILRLHLQQFAALGLAAGALGCLLGLVGQSVLAAMLQPLVNVELPAPSLIPLLQGFAAGGVLLLGFAIPPLVALRRVPTLRVLRRDLGVPDLAGFAGYLIGVLALAGLVLWESQDLKVGAYVLGGTAATMIVSAGLALGLMRAFVVSGTHAGFAWRFGLANLRRRPLGTVTQVVALGVGIMALVLLTLVRSDLLASWKKSLPPDAPNRFIVSIQPEQVEPMRQFFAERALAAPTVHPMVRGRLTMLNERAVSSADYPEERAKRLVDREFNLSWTAQMQSDNRLFSGRWWSEADRGKHEFSVEEGLAKTLGIALGDRLTYEIAGERLEGRVTSLRKVEWDSFHVNFFVVTPPGALDAFPVSYVTSFHLGAESAGALDELVKRFPNFVVIDVASILAQIQRIMDQVVRAVEFVFLFGLLAGLMVLFAAISATHDERLFDAAILRTLGASSRQLLAAHAAEFAAIGALAGLLAAFGASALSFFLATRVLNVAYHFNPWIWLIGFGCGTLGVLIAGLAGTWRALSASPMSLFREAM